MSIRRRLRKIVAWGVVLTLAIVVGASIAAYYYATESDALAEWIAREAPRYLPGCRAKVLRAKVRPFAGKVTLDFATIAEVGEDPDAPPAEVASLQQLQIRYDPWAMTKGRFEPRDVLVHRPRLHIRRRADGSWNVQGLLADPWPGPKGGATPPIRVTSGSVELEGEGNAPGSPLAILRDVEIEIPARTGPDAPFAFELEAKGEMFDRVRLAGTIDPRTGRVELGKGDLFRLTFSEADRGRLPAEVRAPLTQVGLTGGEVDVNLSSLAYDPAAAVPLSYRASAHLRRGLWSCPNFPFPISDVSVDAELGDGLVKVESAKGSNGATSIDLVGWFRPGDMATAPFEVRVEASKLELDDRLRAWTPKPFRDLWGDYFPMVTANSPGTSAGRVTAVLRASRATPGAEVAVDSDVELLDVSLKYRHFAYPLDHVRGRIHATPKRPGTPKRLEFFDVRTLVGNRPLVMNGTVDDPGPSAVARLRFKVDALPIDEALLEALPHDVKGVVDDFKPTGTVRGTADLVRLPPSRPGDDPKGRVTIDSSLEFNPDSDCSITWKEMKYPVRFMTGKLEIHPGHWAFRDIEGKNGQARIRANGDVRQVGRKEFQVALSLAADNLPFDQQLRDALPRWGLTWSTLNPTGACDMKATIKVDPLAVAPRPKETYQIEITPLAQTGVNLRFNPVPSPGESQPRQLEMKLDDLTGRFVFDTTSSPPMTMTGVGFAFQRAPVTIATGRVDIKDTGQFRLTMDGLEVSDLRLDEGVRGMMPQVTAAFARRLDDRKLGKIRADLDLGWSGKPGESARCTWKNGLVVLVDNRILIGTDLALDHIEGQVDDIHGSFDGKDLSVRGRLGLDSVSVFDLQVTGLRAKLAVGEGWASMTDIAGSVLGGAVQGKIRASLDVTPKWSVNMKVDDLDLRDYAKTQRGEQTFKGLVGGWAEISGLGYDPRTVNGGGQARVVQGDLGTLPVVLRLFNVLKLARDTKTAFDSAEVGFKVVNGETALEPVRLVGNAFSLDGKGTLDVRGDLEVKLRILAGRDAHHVPVVSDLTRELSGQFFAVRVFGPITAPIFKADPLSGAGQLIRNRASKARSGLLESGWRTGLEARAATGILGKWRNGGN